MEKFFNGLWMVADAMIILGLGLKVLAGDGNFMDWLGLIFVVLGGLCIICSWIFPKKPENNKKNPEDE